MARLILPGLLAAASASAQETAEADLAASVERLEVAAGTGEAEAIAAAARAAARALGELEREAGVAASDLAAVERLGTLALQAGQLEVAEQAFTAAITGWELVGPPDSTRALALTGRLALCRRARGDVEGALALLDDVVAELSAQLPASDETLLWSQRQLAETHFALGDVKAARAVLERVLAILDGLDLPDGDATMMAVLHRLGHYRHRDGDLPAARALFERRYAVLADGADQDDPSLQVARQNLASAYYGLGDVQAAYALLHQVYEVRRRTLADDAPRLQSIRSSLGLMAADLGDDERARELLQKAHDVACATLPNEHPALQQARDVLAKVLRRTGDLQRSLALMQQVCEVYERTLDEDQPKKHTARLNLGFTLQKLGELDEARGLLEQAHAALARLLPGHHRVVQAARRMLLSVCWSQGDLDRAVELALAAGAATRDALRVLLLAPRPAATLAEGEWVSVHDCLSLATVVTDAAQRRALEYDALWTSQLLRGVSVRLARETKALLAGAVDGESSERLLAANTAVSVAARGRPSPAASGSLDEPLRARNERLLRAVHEKETLERRLLEQVRASTPPTRQQTTPQQVAAALPEDSAAVAILGYRHRTELPGRPGWFEYENHLTALVLRRGGGWTRVDLGPSSAIAAFEDRVGIAADPAEALALRRRVVDPILAALGPETTVYASLDVALELVALDALPLDSGEPVGQQIAWRFVTSLVELCEHPTTVPGAAAQLLAFGGIDYDGPAELVLPALHRDAAPVPGATRGGEPRTFAPLAATAGEVRSVGALFRQDFDAGRAWLALGSQASKATLLAAAPTTTFLHLATHGFFAPEAPANATEPGRRVSALSPMVLTGLALAGANLGADRDGRTPGVVSAEELFALDLSGCFLAVLSACDSSQGVRTQGQGHASLHRALHGAGARYVLSSRWQVGDQESGRLMAEFYRQLWSEKQAPHDALWSAKMALRKLGAAHREWAAWVLTGL